MIKRILSEGLEKRKLKNSNYSLRSYARDLKISPSMLSRFLSGDRNPSPETLAKLLENLDIDPGLKKQILEDAYGRLDYEISKDSDYVELHSEQLAQLNHWIYFALLELFRSTRRKFTVRSIAKALNQNEQLIEEKIAILLALGLLKKTQSGFRAVQTRQTAKNSRTVLDEIHAGYLDQAKVSMLNSLEATRDITGTTILSNPAKITEARERIKTFRRSLASFLSTQFTDPDEKLYRIQIALYPLE